MYLPVTHWECAENETSNWYTSARCLPQPTVRAETFVAVAVVGHQRQHIKPLAGCILEQSKHTATTTLTTTTTTKMLLPASICLSHTLTGSALCSSWQPVSGQDVGTQTDWETDRQGSWTTSRQDTRHLTWACMCVCVSFCFHTLQMWPSICPGISHLQICWTN